MQDSALFNAPVTPVEVANELEAQDLELAKYRPRYTSAMQAHADVHFRRTIFVRGGPRVVVRLPSRKTVK